jgi:transposase
MKPEPLRLSANQKKELFDFIKKTKNKEEYRRAVAVKHKMEGMSYRTIAMILGVNYRNVYYMIKSYKGHGLGGIKSKRKNAGRIPKISSDKNKQLIKDTVLKSQIFWISEKYLEYQAFSSIPYYNSWNQCQSNADMENRS